MGLSRALWAHLTHPAVTYAADGIDHAALAPIDSAERAGRRREPLKLVDAIVAFPHHDEVSGLPQGREQTHT